MKKNLILLTALSLFLTLTFKIASAKTSGSTIKYYSHKPFPMWDDDELIKLFEISPDQNENQINVNFIGKVSHTNQLFNNIINNGYLYHYYNDQQSYGRKKGEFFYLLVKKDDNAYFIIKTNLGEHLQKKEDLKMMEFYYLTTNKKELKTKTEESLKPEAEQLCTTYSNAWIEKTEKDRIALEKEYADRIKLLKNERNDPNELKVIQTNAKSYIVEKFGDNCQLKKVIILNKNWRINRNGFEQVTSKTLPIVIFYYKPKDNKCYITYNVVGYQYEGNAYSKELVDFDGGAWDIKKEEDKVNWFIYDQYKYPFPCEEIK